MCKGGGRGGCANREECESGSVPRARWTEASHAELPSADEPKSQGSTNLTDISFNLA